MSGTGCGQPVVTWYGCDGLRVILIKGTRYCRVPGGGGSGSSRGPILEADAISAMEVLADPRVMTIAGAGPMLEGSMLVGMVAAGLG